MIAKFKKSGQSKDKEAFPVIEQEDMRKIRNYFDRSEPAIIQQEVIFNLIYYFGLRGRETLPYFTKESIICESDSNGKRFLRISHELLSKNAKNSLLQKEYEDMKKARAYENQDRPQECPVSSWELYSELVKTSKFLFPKPSLCKSSKITSFCTNQPLGKHSIDNLMAKLSAQLHLSRRYTNHCIRVTMITVLKENGFSNTDISLMTGHKNPLSVERYARKRRDTDYSEMGMALHMGSTSSAVEIQHISKKCKVITVSDPTTSHETDEQDSQGNFSLHFNGTFSNCQFYLPNK